MKPVLNKLLGVLRKAPVIPARTGLLESCTTHAVPHPARGTYADIRDIQTYLERKHRHFYFVHERAIEKGVEKLSEYRIIVAAYATHLLPAVRDRLLEWVKKGGILVASGPTGAFARTT